MRGALAFVLAGCAPLGDVPDERVDGATLVNLDTNAFVALYGPVGGDAILVWSTPDGGGGELPVSVSGGALGLVFATSADLNPNSDVPLDLSEADEDLRVEDLLGTYRGASWNVTMGFGGSRRNLKNGAGVRLTDEHWTAGAGIEGGLEWLRIREGGHEDGDPVDTSVDPPDPVDTDTDTDTSGDTGDTVDEPMPPPSTGGCDGNGCGGSSGCACDGDDACGCSSVGFAQAPWALTALAALRRRRARGA